MVHGRAGQLEQWLLTGLFMHVGTDLNVVGTIMINQQGMIKLFNNIEQRCYNNKLGCCIKSSYAYSNMHTRTTPVDSPSCIQYVDT